MSIFNKGQVKKWVGTCPPCPPSSDALVLHTISVSLFLLSVNPLTCLLRHLKDVLLSKGAIFQNELPPFLSVTLKDRQVIKVGYEVLITFISSCQLATILLQSKKSHYFSLFYNLKCSFLPPSSATVP